MLDWDGFLDTYEARIASTERALAEGAPFDTAVLEPFVAPHGLGEFPLHLAARAEAILERNIRLTEKLGMAMSEVQSQMASTSKETSAARGYIQGDAMNVPKLVDKGA